MLRYSSPLMMFLRMFILIFFCKRETSEDFPCSLIETMCCHGDLTLTEDEVLDGNHKHITPPTVWAPTKLNNNQKRFPALLPDFKPWRTRYESGNYGISNHIVRKNRPRFTESPSFVLIRLVLTEIQRFENVKINKEMYRDGGAGGAGGALAPPLFSQKIFIN